MAPASSASGMAATASTETAATAAKACASSRSWRIAIVVHAAIRVIGIIVVAIGERRSGSHCRAKQSEDGCHVARKCKNALVSRALLQLI